MTEQIFKPIPGYDLYKISPDGTVINSRDRILKPYSSRNGLMIELRCNGQRERFLVSQLIEQTYGGSDENKRCPEDCSKSPEGIAT